jgi:four helix bundle protein
VAAICKGHPRRSAGKALDSVGANCAEGDGRYSERQSLQFLNIAKGSARESRYWLRRAGSRNLIPLPNAKEYVARLESIMRRLSAFVSTRRKKLGTVRDTDSPYDVGYRFPSDPIT